MSKVRRKLVEIYGPNNGNKEVVKISLLLRTTELYDNLIYFDIVSCQKYCIVTII